MILNPTSSPVFIVLRLWAQLSSDLHFAPPKGTKEKIQENLLYLKACKKKQPNKTKTHQISHKKQRLTQKFLKPEKITLLRLLKAEY